MLSVVEDITPHCFGRTSAGGRAHFASSRSLSCGLPRSLSLRRHWVESPISIRVVVFYRRSGTFSSLFNGHVGCPMVALRSSAMGSTGDVTSCPPLVMTGADSRTAHRNLCQRVRCVAAGGLFCLWPLGRLLCLGVCCSDPWCLPLVWLALTGTTSLQVLSLVREVSLLGLRGMVLGTGLSKGTLNFRALPLLPLTQRMVLFDIFDHFGIVSKVSQHGFLTSLCFWTVFAIFVSEHAYFLHVWFLCLCVCVFARVRVCVSVCVCLCLWLCLCLLPGGKGTAGHRRTQALKPCLTSSGRALAFPL